MEEPLPTKSAQSVNALSNDVLPEADTPQSLTEMQRPRPPARIGSRNSNLHQAQQHASNTVVVQNAASTNEMTAKPRPRYISLSLQRLTQPRRRYNLPPYDIMQTAMPKPRLPVMEDISPDSRLPWLSPLNKLWSLATTKVGTTLIPHMADMHFDLSDPYMRAMGGTLVPYSELNDKHLGDYYNRNSRVREFVRHRDFTTEDQRVRCNLRQYNNWRRLQHWHWQRVVKSLQEEVDMLGEVYLLRQLVDKKVDLRNKKRNAAYGPVHGASRTKQSVTGGEAEKSAPDNNSPLRLYRHTKRSKSTTKPPPKAAAVNPYHAPPVAKVDSELERNQRPTDVGSDHPHAHVYDLASTIDLTRTVLRYGQRPRRTWQRMYTMKTNAVLDTLTTLQMMTAEEFERHQLQRYIRTAEAKKAFEKRRRLLRDKQRARTSAAKTRRNNALRDGLGSRLSQKRLWMQKHFDFQRRQMFAARAAEASAQGRPKQQQKPHAQRSGATKAGKTSQHQNRPASPTFERKPAKKSGVDQPPMTESKTKFATEEKEKIHQTRKRKNTAFFPNEIDLQNKQPSETEDDATKPASAAVEPRSIPRVLFPHDVNSEPSRPSASSKTRLSDYERDLMYVNVDHLANLDTNELQEKIARSSRESSRQRNSSILRTKRMKSSAKQGSIVGATDSGTSNARAKSELLDPSMSQPKFGDSENKPRNSKEVCRVTFEANAGTEPERPSATSTTNLSTFEREVFFAHPDELAQIDSELLRQKVPDAVAPSDGQQQRAMSRASSSAAERRMTRNSSARKASIKRKNTGKFTSAIMNSDSRSFSTDAAGESASEEETRKSARRDSSDPGGAPITSSHALLSANATGARRVTFEFEAAAEPERPSAVATEKVTEFERQLMYATAETLAHLNDEQLKQNIEKSSADQSQRVSRSIRVKSIKSSSSLPQVLSQPNQQRTSSIKSGSRKSSKAARNSEQQSADPTYSVTSLKPTGSVPRVRVTFELEATKDEPLRPSATSTTQLTAAERELFGKNVDELAEVDTNKLQQRRTSEQQRRHSQRNSSIMKRSASISGGGTRATSIDACKSASSIANTNKPKIKFGDDVAPADPERPSAVDDTKLTAFERNLFAAPTDELARLDDKEIQRKISHSRTSQIEARRGSIMVKPQRNSAMQSSPSLGTLNDPSRPQPNLTVSSPNLLDVNRRSSAQRQPSKHGARITFSEATKDEPLRPSATDDTTVTDVELSLFGKSPEDLAAIDSTKLEEQVVEARARRRTGTKMGSAMRLVKAKNTSSKAIVDSIKDNEGDDNNAGNVAAREVYNRENDVYTEPNGKYERFPSPMLGKSKTNVQQSDSLTGNSSLVQINEQNDESASVVRMTTMPKPLVQDPADPVETAQDVNEQSSVPPPPQ